jgi:phosphoribosylpyrophosphate synthetase
MSFIKTTGEKKLMLFSGRAHPELAEAVAEQVGIELTPPTARSSSDTRSLCAAATPSCCRATRSR